MTVSEELLWRGLIKDHTFAQLDWLDQPRSFYLGVDPTADSLTIGNLAIFMLARRLQKAGWQATLLVGGATSLIGDPGGKTVERQLKSRQEIDHNVSQISTQVSRLCDVSEFRLVNNYDWLKEVNLLEFLRDIGKYFSLSELVQRDFVTERIGADGSGMSYTEFSYTLLQGYDFWYLYKTYGVELQIGGSDQWGNMLSGVPLIRKKENADVHALSMPLVINKTTGQKFGKSESGAVWLDASKTSPTQFYQFWVNVEDESVESYLRIYTDIDQPAIEEISRQHEADRQKRTAQRRLAQEVTTLVHGPEAVHFAELVTGFLTGSRAVGEADEAVLAEIRRNIPRTQTAQDGSIVAALVATGLAESNTDGLRLLKGNAISLNGQKVSRDHFEETDFQNGRLMLRRGKAYRDSALIELA